MIGRPAHVYKADQIPSLHDGELQFSGRHIIDVLIDERAKTFSQVPYLWEIMRLVLDPMLGYRKALDWADRLSPLSADDALHLMDELLPFNVLCRGQHHVPAEGPVVILANHPTGMVDGLAVRQALKQVRTDLSYFANRDAVRIVPGFETIIVPVEWLSERRSPKRMRETLQSLHAAIKARRAIVTFPAGGMAKLTIHGLKELPWLPGAIKLIQKHDIPAIPVHIRARNSWVYYLFSLLHEELRDLTRFHEIRDKRNRTFELTFGPPLSQKQLSGPPEIIARQLQKLIEDDLPKTAINQDYADVSGWQPQSTGVAPTAVSEPERNY